MWFRTFNFLLLCCLLPLPVGATLSIEGEQQWQGKIKINETVKVAPGAVLTIAAGSLIELSNPKAKIGVRGRLLVLGSAEQPVVFKSVAKWQGIEFVEAENGSKIEHAVFSECAQGISIIATSPQLRSNSFSNCDVGVQLLRESQSLIEQNIFTNNLLGLKIGMRSNPKVVNNSFSGQQEGVQISNGSIGVLEGNHFSANQVGISLQRKFDGIIAQNRFEKNQIGIYSYQTRNTPLIEANEFLENEQAILAFSFSYPAVRNNRFIGNGTALKSDQFGSAQVTHNLFLNNGTALFNNRKSDPQVQQNRFEGNDLALFCDYSSYPTVKKNNFISNKVVLELGDYQSADWETRAGSKPLLQKQAQARGSRNPLLADAPTQFNDRVDVSGNWWGPNTADLQQAGGDANLGFFIDRLDKPAVSYPGYGDERYQLDLIVYAPWLEAPVSDAGPQEE